VARALGSRKESAIFGLKPGLRLLLAGFLAVLAACAAPHKAPPPSTEIDDAVYRNDIRLLASEEFAGRKPGTPGEDKTVAFLTDQFHKLGLKPVVGESYLQQVPLIEISAAADTVLAVAGRGGIPPLRYGKDMVIWSPGPATEAALHGSEIVFAGFGIVAPEYRWDDYAGTDVRGKTVLILAGDPGTATKDSALFKGKTMSLYGRWDYKVEEAARHGAAGILLIHDESLQGYAWSAVLDTFGGARLELASDEGGGGVGVQGWLTAAAGRGLIAHAGLDYSTLAAAACRPGFKPMAMGLELDTEIRNSVRRFNSANVIGLLPGNDHKHEFVAYSAHWDGLGRDASGALLSGAVDDASGVAGLLVLAQSLGRMRPPPDRSMLFIAFTATEAGLLGSRYYAEHPVVPLEQTAAAINLDGLRVGGRTRDVMLYGAGNSELEDMVRGIALLQGRITIVDPHPEQGLYYASDQLSFALHGVPALFVKAGIDDAARGPQWGLAQIEDYMAHRYRQPSDKYSEDWDVHGAVEDLELYRAVGERVASTHRFPRWYPGSEFSANHVRAPPPSEPQAAH
jgi:Zn-dependent M28 family amino/carboxypeptidase